MTLDNLLGRPAPARTLPKATVVIDTGASAQEYNPMIFGGFIEHLGKQIYGGFFESGSSLADKKGFRLDVIEAIKELKVPVIRWPGGCFVDSYHWQKGVGKVRQSYDDDRWRVLEPNTFGTHEFAGNHLNLLSVHEYWIANYQKHHTPDDLSCMMLSEKPDAHISAVVNWIDGAGMRGRIKIAFDEWNLRSWHHPGFPGHQVRKVDYSDPQSLH